MPRSIHDYVVEQLRDADLDVVHQKTGIPVRTLKKYRSREIANPGVQGIEALFHHFKAIEGRTLRRRAA